MKKKLPILLMLSILIIIALFISIKKEDSKARASNIFHSCSKNIKPKLTCYADYFSEFSKSNRIEYSLETLEELQKIDPQTNYCHGIAHKISASEVRKNPANWIDVFQKIDLNDCSTGFFHGVIEGHIATDPNFILDKNSITNICDQLKNSSNDSNNNRQDICNRAMHAIGHMLLVQEKGVTDKAGQICADLASDLQLNCFIGNYMEYAQREMLSEHKIAEKVAWSSKNVKELQDICNSLSGIAKKGCFRGIFTTFSSIATSNLNLLWQYCSQMQDLEELQACHMGGIGGIAVLASNGYAKEIKLDSLCSGFLQDSEYDLCLSQIIRSIIVGSPKNLDQLIEFCSRLNKNPTDCFDKIKLFLDQYYDKKYIDKLCVSSPQLRKSCQKLSII